MDRKRLLRNPLIWIVAVLLLYYAFSTLFDDTHQFQQVSTSKALEQLQNGNVKQATLEDKEQRLRLTLNSPVDGKDKIITQYPSQASSEIFKTLNQNQGKMA